MPNSVHDGMCSVLKDVKDKDPNNNVSNEYYFQNLVFNTSDLMSKILHYVQDNFNDLINCSLVNNDWRYHVYNIHSMYYFDLTRLVEQTLKLDTDNNDNKSNNKNKNKNKNNNNGSNNNNYNNITRMWQRLPKVKHVCFGDFNCNTEVETGFEIMYQLLFPKRFSPNNLLLTKMSMLTNVEKIEACIRYDRNVTSFEQLLQRCQNKIKWYDVQIFDKHGINENILSLSLINAQFIRIRNAYCYLTWSHMCNRLELFDFDNISENWCNYVIKNCCCSNIKVLGIFNMSFAKSLSQNKSLFEQFASKFEKLEKLNFYFDGNCGCDKQVLFCGNYYNL